MGYLVDFPEARFVLSSDIPSLIPSVACGWPIGRPGEGAYCSLGEYADQAAWALNRIPNAATIFVTVSKLGLPLGESAL